MMKAVAVFRDPAIAPRLAVRCDDGRYYLAAEDGRLSVEIDLGKDAEDISAGDGRAILQRVNDRLERRAAAQAIGRIGGSRVSEKKRRAAAHREPRTVQALASPAEVKRRIAAYVLADELQHGRGAVPTRTRCAILAEDALAFRREIAERLAALPSDQDPVAAAVEMVGAHRLAASMERWRALILPDPTAL